MPDEQKAESEIVRPEPIHADKIKLAVMAYAEAANRMAMTDDGASPAQSFAFGFELALTVAIDAPDTVRDILATIDNGTRIASDGREARADSAKIVVEAARGIEPRETAAEVADDRGIDLGGDDPTFSWN